MLSSSRAFSQHCCLCTFAKCAGRLDIIQFDHAEGPFSSLLPCPSSPVFSSGDCARDVPSNLGKLTQCCLRSQPLPGSRYSSRRAESWFLVSSFLPCASIIYQVYRNYSSNPRETAHLTKGFDPARLMDLPDDCQTRCKR
jgi:hypothetical protein